MPKFSDLLGSLEKFFKKTQEAQKAGEGGQEIRIDSFPGMTEPQKPLLPEIEDPILQVPDISSAISLPERTDPDVEYVNVCAQCGAEFCSYPERKWITVRRR